MTKLEKTISTVSANMQIAKQEEAGNLTIRDCSFYPQKHKKIVWNKFKDLTLCYPNNSYEKWEEDPEYRNHIEDIKKAFEKRNNIAKVWNTKTLECNYMTIEEAEKL